MKKSKGFSLIELMIVTGIIGILVAMAYPYFTNYMLRIKMQEIISEMSPFIKDAQVSLGAGESSGFVDLVEATNNAGLPLIDNWGCVLGTKMAVALFKKNELHYVGITSPYIDKILISGLINKGCDGLEILNSHFDIIIYLDTTALKVKNRTGDMNNNQLHISIAPKIIYEDQNGNVTVKESGSLVACGIFSTSGLSTFDIPLQALPKACRHYRVAGGSSQNRVYKEL